MLPYQQRVIEEKSQLDERIEKLELFLNGPAMIEKTNADLLRIQLSVMRSYSTILQTRILNF